MRVCYMSISLVGTPNLCTVFSSRGIFYAIFADCEAMPQSIKGAVTKYHTLVPWKQQTLILYGSGHWQVQDQGTGPQGV